MATDLLDKPWKDFIVNPDDLFWRWVKRLATSGYKAKPWLIGKDEQPLQSVKLL